MNEILKFEADWCHPCQQLKPILKNVLQDFPDVHMTTLNMDDENVVDLAFKYQVKSVPTLILLYNGIETSKIVGFRTEEQLRELFQIAFGHYDRVHDKIS